MKANLRKFFFKLLLLHRHIGLLAVWIVLWLAITGILLNHTDDLNLDDVRLQSSWLMKLYELDSAPISDGFPLNEQWLVALPDAYYLGGHVIQENHGTLVGGLVFQEMFLLLTAESLVLLDKQFEVIEVQGEFHGLAGTLQQIGIHDGTPIVKSSEALFVASNDVTEWGVVSIAEYDVQWQLAKPLPKHLIAEIKSLDGFGAPAVSLEKVLLDLHTGRLFGSLSWFVLDLFALLLITGALSGFLIWIRLRVKK